MCLNLNRELYLSFTLENFFFFFFFFFFGEWGIWKFQYNLLKTLEDTN